MWLDLMAVLNRGRCYWARKTDPAHYQHFYSRKARSRIVDWKEKVSMTHSRYPSDNAEAFTSARKDLSRANVILPLCHIIGSVCVVFGGELRCLPARAAVCTAHQLEYWLCDRSPPA